MCLAIEIRFFRSNGTISLSFGVSNVKKILVPRDFGCTSAFASRRLSWKIAQPRLIVDSNEGTPDVDSVLAYLERIRTKDAEAFTALLYLEQPTSRDIETAAHDWTPVTRLKPVFLG
jgi:hypothetical protein